MEKESKEKLIDKIIQTLLKFYENKGYIRKKRNTCSTVVYKEQVISQNKNEQYVDNLRDILRDVAELHFDEIEENLKFEYIRRILYKDNESKGGEVTKSYSFKGIIKGSELYVAKITKGSQYDKTIQDILKKINIEDENDEEKRRKMFKSNVTLESICKFKETTEINVTLNTNSNTKIETQDFNNEFSSWLNFYSCDEENNALEEIIFEEAEAENINEGIEIKEVEAEDENEGIEIEGIEIEAEAENENEGIENEGIEIEGIEIEEEAEAEDEDIEIEEEEEAEAESEDIEIEEEEAEAEDENEGIENKGIEIEQETRVEDENENEGIENEGIEIEQENRVEDENENENEGIENEQETRVEDENENENEGIENEQETRVEDENENENEGIENEQETRVEDENIIESMELEVNDRIGNMTDGTQFIGDILCYLNEGAVKLGAIYLENNEFYIKDNNGVVIGKIVTYIDTKCVITTKIVTCNGINHIVPRNVVGRIVLKGEGMFLLGVENNKIGEFYKFDNNQMLYLRDMDNLLAQCLISNCLIKILTLHLYLVQIKREQIILRN
ncbi:hypothetical protein H8356DRAFT_1281987 [Neocallimastix lanati (nom. inval.)]|nr:hypothetical protein H8356DRAFT_1281987 [Neocallimastix sp. JGI-2020a]